MKQAKSDIFIDAKKRVTKGNIIKKKNEMLKDELYQSQSNAKEGGVFDNFNNNFITIT